MKELNEAVAALEGAEASYRAACQSEDTARRERTAALNALNEAQKKFDAVVDVIKSRRRIEKDMTGMDNDGKRAVAAQIKLDAALKLYEAARWGCSDQHIRNLVSRGKPAAT